MPDRNTRQEYCQQLNLFSLKRITSSQMKMRHLFALRISSILAFILVSLLQLSSAQESPATGTTSTIISTLRCDSGFTNQDGTCVDINECTTNTNNCDTNAQCSNTQGSFTCSCNTGFTGDGVTCIASNICETQGNSACFPHGCMPSGSSFNCVCNAGFTGSGQTCNDLNECTTGGSNCHANATCTNTEGSFTCMCNSGFTGDGVSCTDINECMTGTPCDVNATCTNTPGSFSCACNEGFSGDGSPTENGCVAINVLLEASQSSADETISSESTSTMAILDSPIPIGSGTESALFISTSGVVGVGEEIYDATGGPPSGAALATDRQLFAVFWANIQVVQGGNGNRVFYHLYRSDDNTKANTDAVFSRANAYVNRHLQRVSGNAFTGLVCLVVTWDRVLPYLAEQNRQLALTFQLALISDGLRTFAIYLYQDGNMGWPGDVAIGYALQSNQRSFIRRATGGSRFNPYTIRFDSTALNGVDVILVGSQATNLPFTCFQQFRAQPQNIDQLVEEEISCPSSRSLINFVSTFRIYRERTVDGTGVTCFLMNNAIQRNNTFLYLRCCYDDSEDFFPPVSRLDVRFGPLSRWIGSQTNDVTVALRQDDEFFGNCCPINFASDCFFYDMARPIADGSPTASIVIFQGRGDPHIVSLDGKEYTYNGLGDYVFLQAIDVLSNLTVHSRTSIAPSNDSSIGTIFSGFAFTEIGIPTYEVLLNTTTQAVTFFIDGVLMDLNTFTTARSVNGTYITYLNNNSIVLSFPSGTAARITALIGLLRVTLELPRSAFGKTRGLGGVYNNDPNDDFTLPNGTVININSTEEQIFFQFGNAWAVSSAQSLFTQKVTFPSFTPIFFTNVNTLFGNNTSLQQQAISVCGGSGPAQKECLYDVFATQNLAVGMQTSESKNEFETQKTTTNAVAPVLEGPTLLNLTFGQTQNLMIRASSNSTSAQLTYSFSASGASVNISNTTGAFSILVNSIVNVSLELMVTDLTNNLSSSRKPIIRLCYCLNGGQCNFTKDNELTTSNTALLRLDACTCLPNYAGAFCERFIPPCQFSPCFPSVTCTATGTTRTCGPCPSGLSGNGVNCYDLNECSNSSQCEHNCTNFVGGFNCTCLPGYQLVNGRECREINECNQRPSVCSPNANCTNTPGSFTCKCRTGFSGNGTSCVDMDECSRSLRVCQQNCTNTQGSFTCSCRSGYTQVGPRCIDINECQAGTHNCSQNATCFNLAGSFICLCNSGFSGDGRQCIALTTSSAVSMPATSVVTVSRTLAVTSVPTTTIVPVPTTTLTTSQPTTLATSVQVTTSIQVDRTSIVTATTTSITPPTTSVVTVPCAANPCQNGGTCSIRNGVVTCACQGSFYGNLCNEQRPTISMTLLITSMSLGGTNVDFSNANTRRDIPIKGSSLNTQIVNALNPDLTTQSRAAEPRAEEARIQELSLSGSSLRVVFSVAFNSGYGEDVNDFRTKLNSTFEGSNYRISKSNLAYTINPSSLRSADFDECSTSPCHSQATCTNTLLSFSCSCKSGYEGSGFLCTESDTNRTTVIISVTVTLGCLLLLIMALMIFYHFKQKRKLNLRGASLREGDHHESENIWAFINTRLRARVRGGRREQAQY